MLMMLVYISIIYNVFFLVLTNSLLSSLQLPPGGPRQVMKKEELDFVFL